MRGAPIAIIFSQMMQQISVLQCGCKIFSFFLQLSMYWLKDNEFLSFGSQMLFC